MKRWLTSVPVFAQKEVILCAGALDTPKLLLLSGIGPRKQLAKHGIAVVKELPRIGENLQDHLILSIITTRKAGSYHHSLYVPPPEEIQAARDQYMKDKTGPLYRYHVPQMIGYLRGEKILRSKEFRELEHTAQETFLMEGAPHYEILSVRDCFPIQSVSAHEKSLN